MNKTKHCIGTVVTLLFSVIAVSNLMAANYVKIATIGSGPPIKSSPHTQKMVDEIISYWHVQLCQILPDQPDLIVLPEASDVPVGFAIDGDRLGFFDSRGNQVLNYFESVAKQNHCYIAFGSIRVVDKVIYRSSSILINRKGIVAGVYNKNYPTVSEMESGIVPGTEAPIFECDFGRVAPVICFDLNFDEMRDRYAAEKPDIIVFSSQFHGGFVQSTWAYQCRAFFVSAVQDKRAPSEIRNPLGEVVASSTNYFDYAEATVNLDYCLVHLDCNWEKLARLKAEYGRDVTITDPGELGCVMVASNDKDVSARQMIKEFKIEPLDGYLKRSRDFRAKELRE